jgi:hypothetical protein
MDDKDIDSIIAERQKELNVLSGSSLPPKKSVGKADDIANVEIKDKSVAEPPGTSTSTEPEKESLSEIIATATPVVWIEKPRSAYRSFTIRNQDGSGTCVCQTYANEMSILFKEKNSRNDCLTSSEVLYFFCDECDCAFFDDLTGVVRFNVLLSMYSSSSSEFIL